MTSAKQRCGAKTKRGPCKRFPTKGLERCSTHGSGTPAAKRKSAALQAEERARKMLVKLGRPDPVTDPIAELQQVAGEATAWSQLLRDKVLALEGDFRYEHDKTGEQIRGEVQVYSNALRQTADVLARIIALDLEANRLRLEEAKVLVIVKALDQVLGSRELNLTSEQRNFAQKQLVKRLEKHTDV